MMPQEKFPIVPCPELSHADRLEQNRFWRFWRILIEVDLPWVLLEGWRSKWRRALEQAGSRRRYWKLKKKVPWRPCLHCKVFHGPWKLRWFVGRRLGRSTKFLQRRYPEDTPHKFPSETNTVSPKNTFVLSGNTSVVIGSPKMNPKVQLKKVIVVSHDFKTFARIAIIPVMTQCHIANCWAIPKRIKMK